MQAGDRLGSDDLELESPVGEAPVEEIIRRVVPEVVDSVLFYLLLSIDNGELDLAHRDGAGTYVSLRESGEGEMAGWLMMGPPDDWRQRFSKERARSHEVEAPPIIDETIREQVTFPTPDEPARAPVWDNYIVAQVAQASLGCIPPHALALGVQVQGSGVRIVFQLAEAGDQDLLDIDEILENFEALVGPAVMARASYEVCEHRRISPHDQTRWVYISRASEGSG